MDVSLQFKSEPPGVLPPLLQLLGQKTGGVPEHRIDPLCGRVNDLLADENHILSHCRIFA